MKNIGFYIEGDSQIGLGHLFRSISLAKKLELSNFSVEFFIDINPTMERQLEEIPFNYTHINSTSMSNKTIDILIVDTLYPNTKIIDDLSQKLAPKISIGIEPFGKNLDKLFDFSFYGIPAFWNGFNPPKVKQKIFIGAEYIFLPNLLDSKALALPTIHKSIFISLGGGDTLNLAPKITTWIHENFPEFKIGVHKGASVQWDNKEIVQEAEVINNPPNLLEAASKYSRIICAGGLSAFEFSTLNRPQLAIATAPHENQNIEVLQTLSPTIFKINWESKAKLEQTLKSFILKDDENVIESPKHKFKANIDNWVVELKQLIRDYNETRNNTSSPNGIN